MLKDIKQIIAHTTPKEWAEDVACIVCIVFLISVAMVFGPVLFS